MPEGNRRWDREGRLELKSHTRNLMTRLMQELGSELEWVAVAHFNTGHPHVYLAIRGVTPDGNLRLPRNVIKHSIRRHAEDLCTEQLGFRTANDAIKSERREVNALHLTSLDREIHKRMTSANGEFGELELQPESGTDHRQLHGHHLATRLQFLAKLDLAEPKCQSRWQVRNEFMQKLRELQHQKDRQCSMADKASPVTVGAERRRISQCRLSTLSRREMGVNPSLDTAHPFLSTSQ